MNYSIDNIDNGIVLKVDLPGVKKDLIDLYYEGNVLTVISQRNKKEQRFVYTFRKEYDLNTIKAKYEDGVLHITILKNKDAKIVVE